MDRLKEKILESMGYASMCWDNASEHNGVFDMEEAENVADDLYDYILEREEQLRVDIAKKLLQIPQGLDCQSCGHFARIAAELTRNEIIKDNKELGNDTVL